MLGIKWIKSGSLKALYSGKLALLIWVFVIWQPVVFAYKYLAALVIPNEDRNGLLDHLLRLIVTIVRPNGELWFLWALVLFFLVARLSNRLPVLFQLSVAAGVSLSWFSFFRPLLGPSMLRTIGDGWDGAIGLYFFFLIGATLSVQIKQLARSRLFVKIVLLVLWFVAAVVALRWPSLEPLGSQFMVRVMGLAAGFALATFGSRISILALLGRRTLPIYLAHSAVIVLLVVSMSVAVPSSVNPFVVVAVVVLLSILAVSLSLGLYMLRRISVFRCLYSVPNWFSRPRVPARPKFKSKPWKGTEQ